MNWDNYLNEELNESRRINLLLDKLICENKSEQYPNQISYGYNKEYAFSLICSCGNIMNGIITSNDIYDKLHCNCGLVWKVNKPYKEE